MSARSGRTSTPGVVRLSVNLSPSVAAALRQTAARSGVSITEAVRRAVALWQLLVDARDRGHTVLIMRGAGPDAKFDEVKLL